MKVFLWQIVFCGYKLPRLTRRIMCSAIFNSSAITLEGCSASDSYAVGEHQYPSFTGKQAQRG